MVYQTAIKNPKTGRVNQCRAWDIDVKALWAGIKGGSLVSAKAISCALLGDDQSLQAMRDEEYGDSANTNFALSVFENALDWTLGMAVLWFVKVCAAKGKKPGPFTVCAVRSGDVFIVGQSGKVYNPFAR